MPRNTSPRNFSSRRNRAVASLAGVVLLALGASACTVGASEVAIGPAGETVTAPVPAGDIAAAPAQAAEPVDDGNYGPEPLLHTFSISADTILYSGNLVGRDYTFTEVDDRDQDVHYMAIGDSTTAVRASFLERGLNRIEVCVETVDGCGGGDPAAVSAFKRSLTGGKFTSWAPYTLDDGPRIPGGITLGEGVGWDIIDDNFSLDGRAGRCYQSKGFYQWTGDPEPTETSFPAGDIACVLFYATSSEYLVSYDFGGDGTTEISTVRLADTYSEADLAHPAYAPAQFDQAALVQLMENIGDGYDDYQLLAG